MHDPIAYTYDAATHCPGCAAEYAGGQGALDSNTAEDSAGNAIGAIFSWTEWWQIDGKCETLTCDTCLGEIDTAHNDPHSENCPDYEEPEHVHEWGPMELAWMTGNPHRKCLGEGCNVVSLNFDDDDDEE